VGCALFAEDIVRVFLGAKWDAAVPVFRLLAPTIFTFALINPLAWLMMATNRAMRSLKIALLLAPVVVLGYVAGLGYGPTGVAAGFSVATVLLALPVIFWATRGTPITAADTLKVVMRPLCSIVIGAGAAIAAWNFFIHSVNPPLLRLTAANAVLFGTYIVVLGIVTDQRAVYLGLIQEIGIWPFSRRRAKEPVEPTTV
jgi:O-antigen/teichoic acid export membrane protein